MLLRITAEEIEEKLGSFFGQIGGFFVKIFNSVVDALDKFFPHEITLMLLIFGVALIVIFIFTQKINK